MNILFLRLVAGKTPDHFVWLPAIKHVPAVTPQMFGPETCARLRFLEPIVTLGETGLLGPEARPFAQYCTLRSNGR